jgi:hypothetical protein
MCAYRRTKKCPAIEIRVRLTNSLDIVPIEGDVSGKRNGRKAESKIKTD